MSTIYFSEKVDGRRVKLRAFYDGGVFAAEGWRTPGPGGQVVFYGTAYRQATPVEADEARARFHRMLDRYPSCARRFVYRDGRGPGWTPELFFVPC